VTYLNKLSFKTPPFLLLVKCEPQDDSNNATTSENSDAIEVPLHFNKFSKDRASFEINYWKENSGTAWSERVILELLFYSLNGERWGQSTNWLDESRSICTWKGITCQLPESYYLAVDNEGKYHSGSAAENCISDLSSTNTNNAPPEEEFVHIHDYANYFTPEKGAVVTKIELPSNNLTGTLPSELYMLPYLRLINLEENQIHGTIPTTLGLTQKLRFLNLGFNSLTAQIPLQMANMTFLDELLLNNNQLTGTLPSLLTLLPRLLFLDLGYNSLTGTIPPTFGCMGLIEIIYLEHNQFIGTIPPEIKEMEKLRILGLSYNLLSGSLPSSAIGSLVALESFEAENNRLTGSIPKELFQLDYLETLKLQNNFFGGHLPAFDNDEEEDDDFDSEVPKLEKLYLGNNYLTGSIPPNLGRTLVGLRELVLSHNLLTGSIPEEMADLKELRQFDLSSNELTGYVPEGLSNLIFLYHLNMTNNKIVGPIPKSLCEKLWLNSGHVAMFGCDALLCPPGKWHPFGMASEYGGCAHCYSNLDSVYLGQTSCHSNDDEGVFLYGDLNGDDVLSQREILHLLYLTTNGKLWGEKWKDWKNYRKNECELTGILCGNEGQVTEIYLRGAKLCSGCHANDSLCCRGIPSELGMLSYLEMLDLSLSSDLVGTIPDDIAELERLKVLDLSGCHSLTGTIPNAIGKCKSLRVLNLSKIFSLRGTIPPSLGNLQELVDIDLSTNELTGSLPRTISQLRNLVKLDASFNFLTGSIPRSFGNLDHLEYFFLRGNKIGGSIPDSIGLCTSLKTFDLTDNNMTGQIPPSLGSIGPTLEELYLALNSFSGTIPVELGWLSSLTSLDLSQNVLTGTFPHTLGFLTQVMRLDLSFNAISGEIPEEMGLLKKLILLDLVGNRLKGTIPSALCINPNINEGTTKKFGCDAILCAAGMFSSSGFSSDDSVCQHCPEGKTTLYLGSKECLSFSQRDVLEMFYKIMGGDNWPDALKENWFDPEISECQWGGVTCDSNGVIDSLTFPSN